MRAIELSTRDTMAANFSLNSDLDHHGQNIGKFKSTWFIYLSLKMQKGIS
jgi:hypothetical protein